ncbi:MAG: hypothetical protein A2534_02920 [Candidatus Magasanikbacteria bacterium RIFOXYD2_FULL_39_9]|uniref:Uncharacterized protein n=1 Tax=Candidatus Magasanikbacteria bacterium RIFOXYD1_FULL_40_23 TaxID=1798705 RepID=A0A1F6P7H9_9BACT|nr:MAG: hypothetical protein A2563_00895 [Candidatus Magasanikbacteria bacterium RIFOXYD1_FULL_40_23]OGH92204.1 MAG: hypothetical protein A2534_02920 [Candidatus Magasanikbacteria bacterium RIFOXYD2_FULL_39_9]
MIEHSPEQFKTRLDDPEFYSRLKNAIADRLDDLATSPKFKNEGFPLDLGEKIRNEQPIPGEITFSDVIVGVCMDFRLDHEEIDIIKQKFLDKPDKGSFL